VGDVWGQSACLTSLGVLALNRGDAAAAVQCFARVHAIHVEHRGIVREHATTLGNLAEAYRHLGEYDAARGFANQARALAETVESDYDVARSGAVLGRLALGDGDIARAASLIKESLGALWEIGDRWSLVQTLETAAAILGACGQGRKASRLFGAADTLREAMATPIGECDRAEREHDLGHIRLTLEASAFATAWSDGARLALHEAIAEAEAALDGLAGAGP
jgi:hypothetical protein